MQDTDRQRLLAVVADRLQALDALLAAAAPADTGQADFPAQRAVHDTVQAQARQERLALLRSRERLQGADAGLCLACGEPIPLPRLLAIPAARHCVACAEAGA